MNEIYQWTATTSNANSTVGTAQTVSQATKAAIDCPVDDGGWLETIIIADENGVIVKALIRKTPDAPWENDPGLTE